jgi:hypothetical protein
MVPLPAGETVPPSEYWVLSVAVKVVALVGAMVCETAPPSLQLFQTYCVPVPPLCGETTAMVCEDPEGQFNVCVEL